MIAKEDVRPGVMVRRKGNGYHYDSEYEVVCFADSPEVQNGRTVAARYRAERNGYDNVLLWRLKNGKRYKMCIDKRMNLELIQ